MRRLYNADVSEANTPDIPFRDANEMIATMMSLNGVTQNTLSPDRYLRFFSLHSPFRLKATHKQTPS